MQLAMCLVAVILGSVSIFTICAGAEDGLERLPVEMGQKGYGKYCTPCHGPGGAPGSAVYVESKQPIDLRTYASRNGGESDKWTSEVFTPEPGSPHREAWEKIGRA